MRIRVFTVLFQDMTFESALDRAVAAGVTAVRDAIDTTTLRNILGENPKTEMRLA